MQQGLEIVGVVALALALIGSGYLVFAGLRIRAFARRAKPAPSTERPAVTLLKPLHGEEPGLEAALETLFAQDYAGAVQVVFGVQDPADPALAIARRLRERHADREVTIVVDAREHGANRKISNVINMTAQARHGVLILADSDIAVPRDYLARIADALDQPDVGVVSCPYFGTAQAGFWSRLAAMGINYQFLPSVVVGVSLGLAKPCMGSTIALRREVLEGIGGFERFADLLADDYEIGAAVRAAGYRSVVPALLVGHGCAESSLRELVAHELRWASTVRLIDPAGFFGSAITHAVAFALLGNLLLPYAPWAFAILVVALTCRLWMVRQVEKMAGLTSRGWWLIPARDILSFTVFVGSFFVRRVEWRGTRFHVDERGGLSRI